MESSVINDAGELADWVDHFLETMKGEGPGSVPCGECVGCCTSSKFILVRPSDFKAKAVIPEELLFPAPGLPKGFLLMGYNELGHCPMFRNGKCSIYESRPETCRQYDCRVLAATNASLEGESETIADQVNSWRFSFEKSASADAANAIRRSMKFLKQHSMSFPEEYIPVTETQLSALAVRIHREFMGPDAPDIRASEIIDKIVAEYPAG
jgi:Fe-S-cluster containining protein